MNIFNRAVAEHGIRHIYALLSGGHDSLAATALASEHSLFEGVIHINTGIGIEETRQFVRDTCSTQNWPLTELFAGERRYEDLVLTRGGFPFGVQSHNAMLFYLKQQPLQRWLATVTGTIGFVTGIRKEESVRRMGAGMSTSIYRRVDKDPRKVWINPILDWTKIDCGRLIAERGLARNRVVDLLHRSGECLCGALARPGEIHEIARWFPMEARRINDLEHQCEAQGLTSTVWASGEARGLSEGQGQLFSKADLAPLCVSCKTNA